MTPEKILLRRQMRQRKALLTDAERRRGAEAVFSALERTAAFLLADRILMYHSLPDELPTREFIDRWASRKRFYLPRVNGVNLEILPYERTRLHLGAFEIEEPDGDDVVDPDEMELIVVPAVALDRRGNRLGRGKGFYDRLLPQTRATTVGVGFDCQLVDELPVDPFDVPLDLVITETTLVRRSPRR